MQVQGCGGGEIREDTQEVMSLCKALLSDAKTLMVLFQARLEQLGDRLTAASITGSTLNFSGNSGPFGDPGHKEKILVIVARIKPSGASLSRLLHEVVRNSDPSSSKQIPGLLNSKITSMFSGVIHFRIANGYCGVLEDMWRNCERCNPFQQRFRRKYLSTPSSAPSSMRVSLILTNYQMPVVRC